MKHNAESWDNEDHDFEDLESQHNSLVCYISKHQEELDVGSMIKVLGQTDSLTHTQQVEHDARIMKYYLNDFGLQGGGGAIRPRPQLVGNRNTSFQGSALSVNSQEFIVSSNGDEEQKDSLSNDPASSMNKFMLSRMNKVSEDM